MYVLDKPVRSGNRATLFASGRDIRDRKIELEMNPQNCVWMVLSDTLIQPQKHLPDELACIYGLVGNSGDPEMVCSNTGLANVISSIMDKEISPKGLKQMMNKYRYELEAFGVFFESKKSNGQKYVVIKYCREHDSYQFDFQHCDNEEDSSASSVSSSAGGETSVSFVPSDPVEHESIV